MSDFLEDGRRRALLAFDNLPPDSVVNFGALRPDRHVWLGMGLLIGKGMASYFGQEAFRLTPKGQNELAGMKGK